MSQKPILVVMAAGMGSRYGGLKQIDPVGSHGEAILDYSLFDAREAGFETAVIIIKEAIREEFMATVGKRLQNCPMEIHYAYQELTDLPDGYTVPEGRIKPWGTSHAVLTAALAIGDAPFAVINADDYYGKSAYRTIFAALSQPQQPDAPYFMVGYHLGNTVTDHGSVTRGLCTVENGQLTAISECSGIEKFDGGIRYPDANGNWIQAAPETIVSMNLWGFTPSFLPILRQRFPAFLEKALRENPMKAEYLLPITVQELLKDGNTTVHVLSSADQWYGVTYAADRPLVAEAIHRFTDAGMYPDGLWK